MNIILFIDTVAFAGTERHVLDLGQSLVAAGVNVTVACPAASPLTPRCTSAGLPVLDVPSSLRRTPRTIRILAGELRAGRVDIIHAHNGRTHLLAVAAVKRAGRGSVVATQHFLAPNRTGRRGPKAALANRLHHWAERNTAAFVAISNAVKEQMLARGDAPSEKITVVHNGTVEPESASAEKVAALRAELNIGDRPMVFCAARLQKEKDIPTLIKAFALLEARSDGQRATSDEQRATDDTTQPGIHKEVGEVREGGERGCGLQGTGDGWDECAGLAGQGAGCGLDGDDHHKDTTTRRGVGTHKEVGEGYGGSLMVTTGDEQRATDDTTQPGIHKEVGEVRDGGEQGCGLQGTEDGWDECAGLAGQGAGCGLDGDDHHKDTTTRRDGGIHKEVGEGYGGSLIVTTGDEQRINDTTQPVLLIAGEGDQRPECERLIRSMNNDQDGDEGIHKEVAEGSGGGDGGKNSEFRIQNLEANRSVALPKSSAFCLPSSVFSSHCSMYLLGFRSDVSALMAACDIFVSPCPVEGFGLVLLEAMALGKPVIAAAAGGPLEIVADGETGLLFEPGNAGSLAGAMRRLLADPDLRGRMGIAGRRRYAQKFTARRMAEKMQEVYRGVTG